MKDLINFTDISRQNTGTHFLDSGGTSGRHWQSPLPDRLITLDSFERNGKIESFDASIALGQFLDLNVDIDHTMFKRFKKYCNKTDESSYDCMHSFAESLGYNTNVGDNSYNHDNDLDQNFQINFFTKDGAHWMDGDCLIFIQTHNGCDVRGGYSTPVPVKFDPYDAAIFDFVVGWSFIKGWDNKGFELDQDALLSMDEGFQIGYTSAPTYEFHEEIKEILEVNTEANTVKVRMNDGSIIIVYPYIRTANGCMES